MTSFSTRTTQLFPRMRVTHGTVLKWMQFYAESMVQSEPLLTDLDSAIGDGDHGVNMLRGMKAVTEKLNEFAPLDLSGLLRSISILLTTSVGGAAGPLYGAFFLQGSRSALYKLDLALADLTMMVEVGSQGVVQLGKASPGDKTMVDTLNAAVTSLRGSCARREALSEALLGCVKATELAARGTIPMVARKGRASYLGERSAGFQDPGATSAHLLFESLAKAFAFSMSSTKSLQPQRTNAL